MAIIRYNSSEETISISNINNASEEELINYLKELIKKRSKNWEYFKNILLEDKSGDVESARIHFYEIDDAAMYSSPFDKKILKDDAVTSIDNLDINDFRDEKNFRKCLESYYKWLKMNDDYTKCCNVLETKYGLDFYEIEQKIRSK